jgi:hypothetical protein
MMGRICGTYGGRKSAYRVWGDLRERDYLEDLDVDGRIILKRNFKKWIRAWT